MDQLLQQTIDNNLDELRNHLEPVAITGGLVRNSVLTHKDEKDILFYKERTDRVDVLLSRLKANKSPFSYKYFISELSKNRCNSELIKSLQEEEKRLRRREEDDIKDLVGASINKEPFIFLEMVYEIAEAMDMNAATSLCQYFEVDPPTTEKNPGLNAIILLRRKGFVTEQHIQELEKAAKALDLPKVLEIFSKYEDINKMTDFKLTIGNGSQVTPLKNRMASFLKGKKLRNFFATSYGAIFVRSEYGSVVLYLKIPSEDVLEKLHKSIKFGKLAKELSPILQNSVGTQFPSPGSRVQIKKNAIEYKRAKKTFAKKGGVASAITEKKSKGVAEPLQIDEPQRKFDHFEGVPPNFSASLEEDNSTTFLTPGNLWNFRKMICQLSTVLSETEVEKIAFLTGNYSDYAERPKNLFQLIANLEKKGGITHADIQLLTTSLETLESKLGLDVLLNFKKSCFQYAEPLQCIQELGTLSFQDEPFNESIVPLASETYEFRALVQKLEEKLTSTDVEDLSYLMELSLESYSEDRLFHCFIEKLESEGNVTEEIVDLLLITFEKIQLEEPLALMKEYAAFSKGTKESKYDPTSKPSDMESTEDTHETTSQPHLDETNPSQHFKTETEIGREEQNELHVQHISKCNPKNFQRTASSEIVAKLNALNVHYLSNKFTVLYSMTVFRQDFRNGQIDLHDMINAFLSRIMSYDFRARQMFRKTNVAGRVLNHTTLVSQDTRNVSFGTENAEGLHQVSCLDIVSVILNNSDSFFRQDVLSKMSSCQLSVPILLPNFEKDSILLLLWGLQRVTKAWKSPQDAIVHERKVLNCPFPTVTALRIGKHKLSKSLVLNRILSLAQGTEHHPFFMSREEDSTPSFISQGTLEALWYVPQGRKETKFTISNSVCFFNLRGDGNIYHKQRKFACRCSNIVIAFIDNRKSIPLIEEDMKGHPASIIAVLFGKVNHEETTRYSSNNTSQVVYIDASQLCVAELAECLFKTIQKHLPSCNQQFHHPLSHPSVVSICNEIGIEVDSMDKECLDAENSVRQILKTHCREPDAFKTSILRLHSFWQRWSLLDKDNSWRKAHDDVEKRLKAICSEKEQLRSLQRSTDIQQPIIELCRNLMKPSPTYRQYFIYWMQNNLQELSRNRFIPLANNLVESRRKMRRIAMDVTKLNESKETSGPSDKQSREIETKIGNLSKELEEERRKIDQYIIEFDNCHLGFDHFIRELGQLYECFSENPDQVKQNRWSTLEVGNLPQLVAEILLLGQPVEIFYGDAGNLACKWLKGIFDALIRITNNKRVYVISVIGTQSSGKSTLMNSMFGVRFPVSSGRCTRGVFLQILPISKELTEELNCDFIAILDTEGLRAPETLIPKIRRNDNEIATFILCASDMTLLNISGQTLGEDITNILQIAAHAFMRMKKVNLRSSLYLIQQFVADITAHTKNETSTRCILKKLDEAVLLAAQKEGMQKQYKCFSDCFEIVNVSDAEGIQYVPSLWRNNMYPPNYKYSETVLELKLMLLKEIKNQYSKQTISEFSTRLHNVWEAVKQEDFVFNFRNAAEIARYDTCSLFYANGLLRITQHVMEWELRAKHVLRNERIDKVQSCCEMLIEELQAKLGSEVEKLRKETKTELQKPENEISEQHSSYFFRDLKRFEKETMQNVKEVLTTEKSYILKNTNIANKELSKLKDKFRNIMRKAVNKTEEVFTEVGPNIDTLFENIWQNFLSTHVESKTNDRETIQTQIQFDLKTYLREIPIGKDVTQKVAIILDRQNLSSFCHFAQKINSVEEVSDILCSMESCCQDVTKKILIMQDFVTERFADSNFSFTKSFLNDLKKFLKPLPKAHCHKCKNNAEILITLCCFIFYHARDNNFKRKLSQIMNEKEMLGQLIVSNISGKDQIKSDVRLELARFKSTNNGSSFKRFVPTSLLKAAKNWVMPFEETVRDRIERKFYKHIAHKTNWYCPSATRSFIEMANSTIQECCEESSMREELELACAFYIKEAVKSETNKLSQFINWDEVAKLYPSFIHDFQDQVSLFISVLGDMLPFNVLEYFKTTSLSQIETYASIPIMKAFCRHALDQDLLTMFKDFEMTSSKWEEMLSVIHNAKLAILKNIAESQLYDSVLLKTVLYSLLQQTFHSRELTFNEQAQVLIHISSWALPIIVDMQLLSSSNDTLLIQFKKEKQFLSAEFTDVCLGVGRNQRAAQSFYVIAEDSLKESFKNSICTSLLNRVISSGENLFVRRSSLLKTILKELCEEESFKKYWRYIHNHHEFVKEWILDYIVKQCCKASEDGISLRKIALDEAGKLMKRVNEFLFEAEKATTQDNISSETLLHKIKLLFVNYTNSTLNAERLKDFETNYQVTDIPRFWTECQDIIEKKLKHVIFQSAHLPECSESRTRAWLQKLPEKIHITLANRVRGCGSRCPFCKVPCDDTLVEHSPHRSAIHYPRGISGSVYKLTGKLICNSCSGLVASESGYYHCKCSYKENCKHETTRYRDYKIHYKDWDIPPISGDPPLYWQWVLKTFNKDIADYHGVSEAEIIWDTVTKEQALSNITEAF